MLKLPVSQGIRYFREKGVLLREMLFYCDVYRGDRRKRYANLVFEANYRAGSRYIPAPFAGSTHLFLTDRQYGETVADTRLVWRDLSENCIVVANPVGDFMDLLKRPYVKVFAERLAQWMRESHMAAVE
jgi:hypothetical protein